MSHEEYISRLNSLGIVFRPIEPYVNMSVKINHTCPEGHVWSVKPTHIVHSKSGCPYCSKTIKKTTAQHKKEVLPHTFSGEYVSAHSKLEYVCQLGHSWVATSHSVLQSIKDKAASRGCPKCAGNIKLTNEEYDARISPSMIRLTPYRGQIHLVSHKCLVCDNIWDAYPSNTLKGTACPECNGTRKKTTEEYNEELKSLNVVAVQEYVHNKKALLHSCTNGHNIFTTPVNMLYKMHGCPFCRESKGEATLYFIKFTYNNKEYFKVGITRLPSVYHRIEAMRPITGVLVEVLLDKKYSSYNSARYEEQRILKQYSKYRTTVHFVHNGCTEFFTENILEIDDAYSSALSGGSRV